MPDNSKTTNRKLRQLPSVERILSLEQVKGLVEKHSHVSVTRIVRGTIASFRQKMVRGANAPTLEEVIESVERKLKGEDIHSIKPVINATGVVLHTNLGRAPLGEDVAKCAYDIMLNYNNLEYDLSKGERSKRGLFLENLLTKISSAQRALVVNNNAAAVFLILAALSKGKQVIVSRGELVEIGGGFRLPEILKESGAVLKEVGTTNKTSLSDYRKGINKNTALLLKVHKSNFIISGFTEEVSLRELVRLGRKYKLPVVEDLGSGNFLLTEDFGLGHEPTVGEVLSSGVDLVSFSGDKLLGGPQAGIILGKKKYLDILENHPLYRAFRVDKIIISSLEKVIWTYLKKEAGEKIPVWKMIHTPLVSLEERAEKVKQELKDFGIDILTEKSNSPIGGGSLPGQTLPTILLSVKTAMPSQSQAKRFRQENPPIIGRIEKDKFFLDLRTVFPHQDKKIIESLKNVFVGNT